VPSLLAKTKQHNQTSNHLHSRNRHFPLDQDHCTTSVTNSALYGQSWIWFEWQNVPCRAFATGGKIETTALVYSVN